MGEAPETERQLLTKKELAAAMKVTPLTVKRWVNQRGCPHYRIGPTVLRFDLDEVLAWSRGEFDPEK